MTPWLCAESKRRRHWPVRTRHTLTRPCWSPLASSSLSRENARARTGASCSMNCSSAWYGRSVFSRPVRWSHTCRHHKQGGGTEGGCRLRVARMQALLQDWQLSWQASLLQSPCSLQPSLLLASCPAPGSTHLHKSVHAACNQQLAVGREGGALCVALGPKLYLAVQVGGEGLNLVTGPSSCAPEQVKRCARRQHALLLLPAGRQGAGGRAGEKGDADGPAGPGGFIKLAFTSGCSVAAASMCRPGLPACYHHSPLQRLAH